MMIAPPSAFGRASTPQPTPQYGHAVCTACGKWVGAFIQYTSIW